MTLLICIFVGIVYLFCLFCAGVIIKDLYDNIKKDKSEKRKEKT